jgi:hypothetical protein
VTKIAKQADGTVLEEVVAVTDFTKCRSFNVSNSLGVIMSYLCSCWSYVCRRVHV